MGHGSMYIPTPRNALESVLPGYQDGKSPTQSCTCTNGNPGGDSKTGCDQGLRGPAGQSCLWWSQGCSIGCKECATAIPGFDQFHGVAPQAGKLGFNTRSWNSEGAHVPMINATLPKKATHLSLTPAVKLAASTYKNQTIGGDSIYSTTPLATMGDMGSKLPKLPASFPVPEPIFVDEGTWPRKSTW
eukprot:gene16467-30023_t